jgi:hypothetical protein
MVPNPYTLLSTMPATTWFFIVLDLKDAFFTIPLHPTSQPLFTFTWTDPDSLLSQLLTWTVLPQGFQDSPHHFGQAVHHDLQSLHLHPVGSSSMWMTFSYLTTFPNTHYLAPQCFCRWGYRVSKQKTQLVSSITYLGLSLLATAPFPLTGYKTYEKFPYHPPRGSSYHS